MAAAQGRGGVASAPMHPRRARNAPAQKGTPKPAMPTLTSEEVKDKEALLKALQDSDEGRCRALLQHNEFEGINQLDSEGRSMLTLAIFKKLPEELGIEILSHPGFGEVNNVDRWGNTALTLAASNSMPSLCIAVVAHPSFTNVNCKDKWGATALHWAADRDLGSVCTAILSKPGFVETKAVAFSFCFENRTALQRAEEKGCRAAAKAIREHLALSKW